ncbi:MAG: hypothetical protein Q7S95_01415 [bacterium]|nr:hypothetical protein [bacterium]
MAKMTVDDCVKLKQKAVLYWTRLQLVAQGNRIGTDAHMDALNALIGLVPPGLYEHFKSREDDPKFYAVSGVVPDVNGKADPSVKYTALYGPLAGKPAGRLLFDSDDAFWGPIVNTALYGPLAGKPEAGTRGPEPPYSGPRFTRIMMLSVRELAVLQDQAHVIAIYKTRFAVLAKINRELDFNRALGYIPPRPTKSR